ncbi:DEAD/DEAH box helicase [Lysinibacillus sp. LZ02]|uniref:DEAD/DEAH box helicase n=1 Tax=Lysinibacillus sp. LZ02 TaxID=3420668 RepID=UPI003D35BEC6
MKLKRSKHFKQYKGFIIEPSVQNFLCGRVWTRDATLFSREKIDSYIQHGLIEVKAAIREGPICNRCLSQDKKQFITFQCARCNKRCVYCRHCIMMGRMSSCTQLMTWIGPQPRRHKNHLLDWKSQFTPLQRKASEELTESIKQGSNHVLHAVCGAGKTEILFTAIYDALNEGKRVCVATPRTDVVLELYPRFQQVFPHTTIHALYGDAPKRFSYAELIVTTTHQLYRFEQAFDVMIVDEADAFPYTFDESLKQAVIKAKKQQAPIAFVTATPSYPLLQQKKHGGYSFIPSRYHGYPLPVPRYDSLWGYDKSIHKKHLPKKLKKWAEARLANNEPFLLFFPTIDLMEQAIPLFQALHPQIEAVHAEDPDRKEKVLNLRNEQLKGLLTTTILERGITIKNVQVAVIGAESKVFTSSALIQISGRVGRNAQYPTGDVVFFHHGITVEMDAAKEEIRRLNKEGFPHA